jgi:uncharacterized RDD family membrane protein YckC
MTARQIAQATSANSMVLRRWLGAWLDFVALFLIFLAVAGIFGEDNFGTALMLDIVLIACYFIVLEAKLGWTVGKLATGLRVVDDSGKPPGVKAAVIRTLLRLFEVNPFLFGGIPAGIAVNYSQARQRLGDMAAGTYVVPKRELDKISAYEVDPSVFA